jgi:hypothetical protein
MAAAGQFGYYRPIRQQAAQNRPFHSATQFSGYWSFEMRHRLPLAAGQCLHWLIELCHCFGASCWHWIASQYRLCSSPDYVARRNSSALGHQYARKQAHNPLSESLMVPMAHNFQRCAEVELVRKFILVMFLFVFSDAHSQASVAVGQLSPGPARNESQGSDAPWFQPVLTTKADPICDSFLIGVRGHAPSYAGLKNIPAFFSADDREKSSVQNVAGHPDYLVFGEPGKHPLYVQSITYPGCGGACESVALGLHSAAPTDDIAEEATDTTPTSEAWNIFESASGHPYVVAIVDRQFEVYSAAPDTRWKLACRIHLEPDLQHTVDLHVQEAAASLHELGAAAEGMALSEGYGMCGTMHTAGRWQVDFEHALGQVLFDPEATAVARSYASENSYGDYSRIHPELQEWGLGGIFEHRALQRYDDQLASTTKIIQKFYEYGFHWTPDHSLEVAQRSITGAVGRLFGFYMYDPYPVPGERKLRQALLTHQPIAEIRAMTIDLKALDSSTADSILNVAVENPEALSYLVERGVDPDRPNGFGKTPLMYAVQYNQLAAMRALLRAGADPNAMTTGGPDNCEYAIQWRHVTPLHYAVRYASREVVQALLEAGAVPFVRTEHYVDSSKGDYPLDWLEHQSHQVLSAEDVKVLEPALRVPSDAERVRLSTTLASQATAANLAGNRLDAYRAIRLARLADPTNTRVAADFPLLALKAGEIGPALEGSAHAFAMAKTPSDQAAALFNEALACEQIAYDPRTAVYHAASSCGDGGTYVDLFVRAWELQPTPARVKALIQRLGATESTNCAVTVPAGGIMTYRVFGQFGHNFRAGQSELMYALHSPSLKLDPSTIRWTAVNIQPPVTSSPQVRETLILDQDHELTVLEGEYFASAIVVDGKTCNLTDVSSPKPQRQK